MTTSRSLLVIAGTLVVAALVALVAAARDPQPRAETPSSSTPAVPPPSGTTGSAPVPAVAHPAAPSSALPELEDVVAPYTPTDVLLAGLRSDDAVIVAEAVNALVARGAVDALPALIREDVLGRPKAAPSIIYALGRLAGAAAPAQHEAAVDRLLALMAEEKRRDAQESQGNLLQIYEALGDTGSPRAIAPLERELVDPGVKTAPKVVVVQALVALHAVETRPTLEQLATQLAPSSIETGLEAELRRDLLSVIQAALVQLS